ncbi:MAG: PHP domain-containing protein [Endomicrobiaceae bacterium]|nr:PHP domain-containing protein [Endomicrobiaceae bacterium]
MQHEDFFVDLHIHTSYSDGVFSPFEAVAYASKVGLSAISITDHDTVDGIGEAIEAGKQYGVEVIPGIELSAELDNITKTEMHILGYYINWKSQTFKDALSIFKKVRVQRAKEIFSKLESIGIKLKPDGLIACIGEKIVGRLHFAKALLEGKYVSSISDAFQKYLGIDKPAYVPKHYITPADAIGLIIRAGGIPVLAHPYYGHYSNKNIFKGLINDGLMGIEAWHNRHPQHIVKKFLSIADEMNLIATGGSDCHGAYGNETPLMGKIKVPYSVVELLEEKKRQLDKKNNTLL